MGRIIRIAAVIILAGAFVALIIFNASSTPADEAWDEATTMGNLDAKNHYIFYTDLMCPYCDAYSRLIAENKEEFQRDYLEGKDILYEIRLTDFLYEYGEHKTEYSRQSAEAAYCAARENKFWDFYEAALNKLNKDYHSKGIGVSKTSPQIKDITDEYWLNIGKSVGLGEQFETCYKNHETVDQIKANTAKVSRIVDSGLPYFKFGKFSTGGFDQSWDWSYVKKYLDAGL